MKDEWGYDDRILTRKQMRARAKEDRSMGRNLPRSAYNGPKQKGRFLWLVVVVAAIIAYTVLRESFQMASESIRSTEKPAGSQR